MYYYCRGIKLNASYQEVACGHRDRCPYYKDVDLSKVFSNPCEYEELDTYDDKECIYNNFDKLTQNNHGEGNENDGFGVC